jgi:hypothetical protein
MGHQDRTPGLRTASSATDRQRLSLCRRQALSALWLVKLAMSMSCSSELTQSHSNPRQQDTEVLL